MKSLAGRFLLLFLFIQFSCTGVDDLPPDYSGPCDKPAVVSKKLYQETSSQNYQVTSARIAGDCLEVELYSGGCDGSTWKVDLYDLGAIAESYPAQRYIKISLTSSELCNAMVTRKFSFDLFPLQINGDRVLLNLAGRDEGLLYRY